MAVAPFLTVETVFVADNVAVGECAGTVGQSDVKPPGLFADKLHFQSFRGVTASQLRGITYNVYRFAPVCAVIDYEFQIHGESGKDDI